MSKFIVKTVTYCLVEAESLDKASLLVGLCVRPPKKCEFYQVQEGAIQVDDSTDFDERELDEVYESRGKV